MQLFIMNECKTIESLVAEGEKLVEVELMLTPKELQEFGAFCIHNGIKFNDWIRALAYEDLAKRRT